MKKVEYIEKHGIEAYEKIKARSEKWRRDHPEEAEEQQHEICRKGGKYYERRLKYRLTGIPHEKDLVRGKHRRIWTPYKQIIAPESQIHHEWLPETANYRGVALVEKEQHRYGIIDVIQILEGKITLLTEEEIRKEEWLGGEKLT